MKKIFLLLLSLTLIMFVKCFTNEGKDSETPTGNGILEVTVDYTETNTITYGSTDSTNPGTGKLYVYLYKKIEGEPFNNYRTPYRTYPDATQVPTPVSNNNSTIKFTDISYGEYFVMAFYDYIYGDNHIDNKGDPYTLYAGSNSFTNNPLNPVAIYIDDSTDPLTISFDATFKLQGKGAFK